MTNPLDPLPDGLLPAAMRSAATLGRRHFEPKHPFRDEFQRDRDRIIHSAAFRRLEYKTQVFVNGEGDHYRTRLTHTLEVCQIARTIARALCLNEDLAEAVALSHDLGHTPFGHAGERELDLLLEREGGFNHNAQGLRVVDLLEKRYAEFDGLNLSYEVREGFVRHGGAAVAEGRPDFPSGAAPLLEVAATIIADDIAYLAHDMDDGLYSGMLDEAALESLELWRMAGAVPGFKNYSPSLRRTTGVRRLINILVTDAVENSRRNIVRNGLISVEKVRETHIKTIAFSNEIETRQSELKTFLFSNFYRHPNVMKVMEEARKKLRLIFLRYVSEPDLMPPEYLDLAKKYGVARSAADYAAGMTDRFAKNEFAKFFER